MHQLTSQGNSAPFLSLLGVSLASGSGLIAKEVEIESVCYEIRQAVSGTRLVQSQHMRLSPRLTTGLWRTSSLVSP